MDTAAILDLEGEGLKSRDCDVNNGGGRGLATHTLKA